MVNRLDLRGKRDLLAVVSLTILLAICILLVPSTVPRIVLGLPFILLVPGYTLVAVLYPRKDSLATTERGALSLILSFAVVPLIGLALNYIWEVSLYPILVSLVGFVASMCALAHLRRARLPVQERFDLPIRMRAPQWRQSSRVDRMLAGILIMALIAALATAIYVGLRPSAANHFSEFYLLGLDGTMEYYPVNILLGADADAVVGVANHEGKTMGYRLRITINDAEMRIIDIAPMQDDECWEETVSIAPTTAGDNQRVQFLLYRDREPEPYQILHLWIDVRDPSAPESAAWHMHTACRHSQGNAGLAPILFT